MIQTSRHNRTSSSVAASLRIKGTHRYSCMPGIICNCVNGYLAMPYDIHLVCSSSLKCISVYTDILYT